MAGQKLPLCPIFSASYSVATMRERNEDTHADVRDSCCVSFMEKFMGSADPTIIT